jgi:hypothetical protein
LVFEEYTAGLKGKYSYEFSIDNKDDQLHTDDSLEGVYFVDKENDIKAYQLVFPTIDTVLDANQPYIVKASFINLGDSNQAQVFSVTMQVFDNGGMVYNSNASITLDAGDTLEVDFPAAFVPDRKANYDYMAFSRLSSDQQHENDTIKGEIKATWSAGINSLKQESLVLSPNPARNTLDVEIPTSFIGEEFSVIDMHGKVVFRASFRTSSMKLDLRQLPAGVYYLKTQSTAGEAHARFIRLK